ncbi:MAG TPA: CAP domain-containing protein [Propionibacteriaceae bacterium]
MTALRHPSTSRLQRRRSDPRHRSHGDREGGHLDHHSAGVSDHHSQQRRQRVGGDVMASWMNSAGHRANILNCALTELGVGYATGGTYGSYWTQDFGTR